MSVTRFVTDEWRAHELRAASTQELGGAETVAWSAWRLTTGTQVTFPQKPGNICFFCRICTRLKPIPHIPVDIRFSPISPGITQSM
jgi:hypothetical protein